MPELRQMLQALADQEGGYEVASAAALAAGAFGARALFEGVVAEEAGRALGIAVYYPDFSTIRGTPGVYVQDLFVMAEARGRGIGRGLLAAVMHLQDWNADYLTLAVSPANTEAQAFYARAGFRGRNYRYLILDGPELRALAP